MSMTLVLERGGVVVVVVVVEVEEGVVDFLVLKRLLKMWRMQWMRCSM